jgi:predicted anti-sigma-YlaC factor YlaD
MNQRCDTHQTDLSALLDGELDAREALGAVDHLAGCRRCRDFWRGARALQAAAGSASAGAPQTPADGWRRIEAAVGRQGQEARGGRRGRTTWAWRIAAALVVGLGLLLALRSAPPVELGPEPGPPAAIEVRAGTADMSERRFVELTTELLRADPDYHAKMLDVMRQVAAPEGLAGARLEGAPASENDPDRGEPAPRRLPGGRVQTS